MYLGGFRMMASVLTDSLERSPVISAVQDNLFSEALAAPTEVIFYLKANILTVKGKIEAAHKAEKLIFIHIDLAEGIGKDRSGVEFLKNAGADGIISTKGALIKHANELGLITVQRFFALDSQGLRNMPELIELSKPDMVEIMPGVIGKIIKRLSLGKTPIISGGLIDSKEEVTTALSCGAVAVSTGAEDLWYI